MFRPLLIAWTLFGWLWLFFDTIVTPENWYNFTCWTWFLQTIFYTLFLAASKEGRLLTWLKMDIAEYYIFLDAYMLPIIWTCEFTAAVAVVYMMVDESTVLDDSLNKNGPIYTWVGNFIIHYLTVIVLLAYIHHDTKRIYTCIRSAREEAPGRTSLLCIVVFTLTHAYATFFPPASHYGIAGITDTATALLLLVVSASAFGVFHNWTRQG